MKFTKVNGVSDIKNFQNVKVKKMNHIVQVMSVKYNPTILQDIRKLNKFEYCIVSTGEVKDYNLNENRSQNVAGLKETFAKIRDLINNNFVGAPNEAHITLTYKSNMQDKEQLYNDFKAFWKRYKRKYGEDIDYLTIVEPQGRGAWHHHLLVRHNDGKPIFIPYKELKEMWGHGTQIKIKSLNNVDNIGAYLSAYLGDVELTEDTLSEAIRTHAEIKEVEVDGLKKRFIKGGRLHMYPSGMNLYRHSKGIVFPVTQEMTYREVKKIVGTRTPNYSQTITIEDEDSGKLLNQIVYENYNMKRSPKKMEGFVNGSV